MKRTVGLSSSIILVIANMIGTGIFTTSGFIMESLHNPKAMLLCWFIGGIMALSGALCYGELGAMFPKAGGEYVFLRESFGNLMGFLSGWISLIVGFSAPIAATAIAFSAYFFRSLPAGWIEKPQTCFFVAGILSISAVKLLAVGMIILFSIIHRYGLILGSRVQNVLTVFKVTIILMFIAVGLGFGRGSMDHLSSALDIGTIFSKSFAGSLIFISFAYSGWNAAAYIGAEIKNPAKNIPLSLLWGTFVVMILYLLLNVVFIYALSSEEMSGVLEVGGKSAQFLFDPKIGNFFSLAVTICLLSVISAMIMTGPRVYYAMAKDGSFFKWFSRISPIHQTPHLSILLQAVIAILMVFTSTFDKLLLYIGFTLSLFAMLTVSGMILLRITKPDLDRPYRTFGYPITPALFILSNLWIIIFALKSNPFVCLYGGGTIMVGIMFFFCLTRTTPRNELPENGESSITWSKID